jgi:xyloglucan fucosyltransferase
MNVKRARSPRACDHGDDDKKRAAGWRGSVVRPELVLVGFLLTLPVLFFVFGGRWGNSSFPSSASAATKPVDRHVEASAGSATPPQSKRTTLLCTRSVSARELGWGDHVQVTQNEGFVDRR